MTHPSLGSKFCCCSRLPVNYLSKVQPKIALSTRQIVFKPGDGQDFAREGLTETTDRLSTDGAPDLTVTVTNTTENFVSFQLELLVEGQPQPTPEPPQNHLEQSRDDSSQNNAMLATAKICIFWGPEVGSKINVQNRPPSRYLDSLAI